MKRSLLLSLAAVLILGTAAAASMPPIVWWSDDMQYGVTNGTPIANTDGWDGDTTGNLLYDQTGIGTVRMSANSGQQGQVWNTGDVPSAGKLQIFHMSIRRGTYGNAGNFAEIYMSTTDYDIAWWYGWSDRLQPRYNGGAGTAPGQYVDLSPDMSYHDLDIVYDPATGLTQWFADGGLLYSATQATGMAVDRTYLWSRWDRGVADLLFIDEMALGTVPEPSSLLAFGVFGVGMLGYIRRRKA